MAFKNILKEFRLIDDNDTNYDLLYHLQDILEKNTITFGDFNDFIMLLTTEYMIDQEPGKQYESIVYKNHTTKEYESYKEEYISPGLTTTSTLYKLTYIHKYGSSLIINIVEKILFDYTKIYIIDNINIDKLFNSLNGIVDNHLIIDLNIADASKRFSNTFKRIDYVDVSWTKNCKLNDSHLRTLSFFSNQQFTFDKTTFYYLIYNFDFVEYLLFDDDCNKNIQIIKKYDDKKKIFDVMLLHIDKINVLDVLNFMHEINYNFTLDDFALTTNKLVNIIYIYHAGMWEKNIASVAIVKYTSANKSKIKEWNDTINKKIIKLYDDNIFEDIVMYFYMKNVKVTLVDIFNILSDQFTQISKMFLKDNIYFRKHYSVRCQEEQKVGMFMYYVINTFPIKKQLNDKDFFSDERIFRLFCYTEKIYEIPNITKIKFRYRSLLLQKMSSYMLKLNCYSTYKYTLMFDKIDLFNIFLKNNIDLMNIIDPNFAFKYACLHSNEYLIDYYLNNKFIPTADHVFYLMIGKYHSKMNHVDSDVLCCLDHGEFVDKIIKIVKKFIANGLVVDDKLYKILCINEKIKKNIYMPSVSIQTIIDSKYKIKYFNLINWNMENVLRNAVYDFPIGISIINKSIDAPICLHNYHQLYANDNQDINSDVYDVSNKKFYCFNVRYLYYEKYYPEYVIKKDYKSHLEARYDVEEKLETGEVIFHRKKPKNNVILSESEESLDNSYDYDWNEKN